MSLTYSTFDGQTAGASIRLSNRHQSAINGRETNRHRSYSAGIVSSRTGGFSNDGGGAGASVGGRDAPTCFPSRGSWVRIPSPAPSTAYIGEARQPAGLLRVENAVESTYSAPSACKSRRSAWTCSNVPVPGARSASEIGSGVICRRIRGQSAGIGLPVFVASALSAGSQRSRSSEIDRLIGCHPALKRTARRIAASLLPPTQIGGCGVYRVAIAET
jgi:hypothetical protein